MVLATRHGEHCDAHLRDNGCVCTDRLTVGRASSAIARLADDMRAREADARARRDHVLAAAYNNRADAYGHAAAIATHYDTELRDQVVATVKARIAAIRQDELDGMVTKESFAQRGVLVRLLVELGWWDA